MLRQVIQGPQILGPDWRSNGVRRRAGPDDVRLQVQGRLPAGFNAVRDLGCASAWVRGVAVVHMLGSAYSKCERKDVSGRKALARHREPGVELHKARQCLGRFHRGAGTKMLLRDSEHVEEEGCRSRTCGGPKCI